MTLTQRLVALAQAIGADVKALASGKAEAQHAHTDLVPKDFSAFDPPPGGVEGNLNIAWSGGTASPLWAVQSWLNRQNFWWSGMQNFAQRTGHGGAYTPPKLIAASAEIEVDCATSNVFEVAPLTANVTALYADNPVAGQTIQIRFQQDAAGGRTVALPFAAKVAGTPATQPDRVSWLVMTYSSRASRWEGNWLQVPA